MVEDNCRVIERWDSREERYHELDTPDATMVTQETITQGLQRAFQWLSGSSDNVLLSLVSIPASG